MIRAFQWDLARQVERLDWLLAQLPRYSRWGYQELHLHLEDAVDYPSLPGIARRDAYSWAQLQQLVTAASAVGIKVVPIVNLLGHTQYLIKHPDYRDLNELRASDGSPLPTGQICPSHPRSLEVARRLIADVAPLCTAGKVHVGLDESFHLGRHPDSARTIAATGLARYFADYVTALHGIAAEHGLRTGIWADMLVLLPDAIAHLPRGLIAYDWYYHAFARHPRFELHNFREYNLVPALRAQGIDYWGCPMNGAFRFEPMPVFGERIANAQAWWQRCRKTHAEGFLVTGWEAYRLALETTVVVDAAIAGLWLDDDEADQVTLLKRGFERACGKTRAGERARQMLGSDERAFAGYARWELNQRWDTVHGRDGASRYAADVRYFQRTRSVSWPPAFDASLRWREYLAIRDHFVRDAAHRIFRARKLRARNRQQELTTFIKASLALINQFVDATKSAEDAARTMWRTTRADDQVNPNESILECDRERAQSLRQWWSAAHTSPALVQSASNLVGEWQLQAIVHTTHPCLQAVVIQTRDAAGRWTDQLQRYLIEFRTKAARRRTNIRHWISLPLPSPDTPVRFALRGSGQFALSDVHLTDGITELRTVRQPTARSRRVTLGRAQPVINFFALDRTANQAVWQPRWRKPPAG
ncbi:family 20 glycosylhydrolase [Synoicihabitans lomoniglobus]|uniref:Family 20 glycosylhydrolase n=1 Tax=Synoicihabitans lomoniglobus TaxID=2909285 RepID=A0AAE9ZTD1_9BACT|nr:family 20 glycosylhydrolase [Opitutaceae bacterium LMO-M01]WED63916.1 family 20 glycosylhydrolase [Opitutaceae bacterium LMO-M01]